MNNKPTYNELEKKITELKNKHKSELSELKKKHTSEIQDYENIIHRYKKITNISEKAAKAGSWSLDVITNNLICSKGMCNIHGIKQEEFDNTLATLRKYVHPEDIEELTKKSKQTILEKKSLIFEYRILLPNGIVRYIRGTNILIFNTAGDLIKIIGMNMDITAQKETEQKLKSQNKELKETKKQLVIKNQELNSTKKLLEKQKKKIEVSNEKFKKLSKLTFEGILISDGVRLFDMNHSFANMFGYEHSEITPENNFMGKVIPDKYMPIIQEKLKLDYAKPYEIEAIKKDGTKIPVELESRNVTYDNKKIRVTAVRDISERKKVEQELFESEQKLKLIIDSASDAIILHDFDQKIVMVNKEFYQRLEYTQEEAMQLSLEDFHNPKFIKDIPKHTERLIKDGNLILELEHISKSGKKIPTETNARIINLAGKKLILAIGRDITERKKAEQTIKDNFNFLNTLIETIPLPIFYKDANFNYIGGNIAFQNAIGIKFKDLKGKSVFDVSAKKLAQKYNEKDMELYQNPGIQVYESKVQFKDGQLHDIIFHKATFPNNEGDVAGIIGVMLDVTERNQVQQSLKESREQLITERNQFLSLLNTIPEPIYVSDINTNKILFANDAKRKIYGNNLVGKLCFEAIHNLSGICTFCPTVEKLTNRKQAYRWIKDDVAKEKTFLNIEKLIDWQDKQSARFQIGFDITELKNAENEIRKLSVAVEQNPATIAITDTQGKLEYVNPKFTELTGYTFEEAKGNNVNILKSEKTPASTFAELWKTIGRGKIWKGEFVNKKKNGKEFIEYATIAPIFNKKGKIINYIAIKEDITEKKKAQQTLLESEAKLQESNDTKDKFFNIIAHDLRSPFNALLGLSEILLEQDNQFDKEKRKEIIELLNISAKNAFSLLENLLTWSRSQSGGIKYMPEKMYLKEILEETIYNLHEIAKIKNIKITNTISEQELVYADKNMLTTIFRNLISNAIKFTEKNGSINISCKKETNNNSLNIYVSDTGVGIPKDKIKDLFRIEKNTSTAGTENETGTGLGLILCKEFIEKHNGQITVKSELGEGTTFTVFLPQN